MRDWRPWLWYETCYWMARAGMTWAFGLRTEGGENIPREGPVLLIGNHQSFLDPVAMGLAAPRHICYLARKTLFRHRHFAGLIRSLNAVPVDQQGIAKEGLKTILEQLKAGQAVLVFPEGERTYTGEVLPLKPGILLLIKRIAVPIVPIGIAGAFEALPRVRKWPKLSPFFLPPTGTDIAVSVGKAIPAEIYRDMPREQVLRELQDELIRVQQRAQQMRRKS
jgi:1-acyl-sn-glycerol-3-phosphate acyltransferase